MELFFEEDLSKRKELFAKNWSAEMMDDLETADLRLLAEFVINEGPIYPSVAIKKRLLAAVLSEVPPYS